MKLEFNTNTKKQKPRFLRAFLKGAIWDSLADRLKLYRYNPPFFPSEIKFRSWSTTPSVFVVNTSGYLNSSPPTSCKSRDCGLPTQYTILKPCPLSPIMSLATSTPQI